MGIRGGPRRDGVRDVVRAVVGASVVVALSWSLTGCTSSEAEWGAEAEQYFADMHSSWRSGFANLGTFFAPDATIDTHTLTCKPLAAGRAQGLADLREEFGFGGLEVSADEPPYLSADGAIDPSRFYPSGLTVPQAPVYEFAGTSGATRMDWTATAQSGQAIVGLRPEPVDRVIADYLRMWTGEGQPSPGLYAGDAMLRDTLREVSLTGSRINDAAAAGDVPFGLRGASLREVPAKGGPAVYALHNPCVDDQPLHMVVLLLDLPGEGDCQPHVGAVLWLDAQGRITREERYHRVDSVRSCLDTQPLPSAWWEMLSPRAARVTGTVTVGGDEVIVWNGTPQREALLGWALQRFADAGLPAPAPTSVTFLPPVADPWTAYGFEPGAPDLVLPSTSEGCDPAGCDEWPTVDRTSALTELARFWAASDTTWTRLNVFAAAHGLAWEDFDVPESQQVANLATAIVTWGLMDQPYDLPDTLADFSCGQLAADFQALTDTSTAGAACSPAGG